MVRGIEQIRRDLNTVTERVATVKQTLEGIYTDYLRVLGESLQRQLVLAGYQLCTQIYPQTFLNLSYNQRQQIQQQLRRLSQDLHQQLQNLLTDPPPEEEEIEPEVLEEFSVEDEEAVEQELMQVFETIDQAIADEEEAEAQHKSPQQRRAEDQQRRQELSQLAERIAESISEIMQLAHEQEPIATGSPEELIEWYRTTEKRLRQVLNQASKDANHLLQEANILPGHIPSKVLDMAIQADNQQNSSQAPTNLVNMVIEADLGKKKKKRTRITAIHLKVSEVEFSDPLVSSQRNRIREQLAKVKKLKQYYHRATQDLAIAEAEAAWRASWHEGNLS